MTNLILILILIVIIGGALGYIVKSKKQGNKCIGCPYAKMCQKDNNSSSPCSCHKNDR